MRSAEQSRAGLGQGQGQQWPTIGSDHDLSLAFPPNSLNQVLTQQQILPPFGSCPEGCRETVWLASG